MRLLWSQAVIVHHHYEEKRTVIGSQPLMDFVTVLFEIKQRWSHRSSPRTESSRYALGILIITFQPTVAAKTKPVLVPLLLFFTSTAFIVFGEIFLISQEGQQSNHGNKGTTGSYQRLRLHITTLQLLCLDGWSMLSQALRYLLCTKPSGLNWALMQ